MTEEMDEPEELPRVVVIMRNEATE
jgi:hypothetical protein